jgi:hypothetical protein
VLTAGFCVHIHYICQASVAYYVCVEVTAFLDVMPFSLIDINISKECAAFILLEGRKTTVF